MAAAEVSLPPGPRLPRLLLTLGFVVSPARFLDACRRRYGDVVWLSTAFDRGFVMVFDPELVREVFQAPPDRLRAGEANAVLGPLLGSRSVLLLDGAEHLRHRRLLLPPFHGAAPPAISRIATTSCRCCCAPATRTVTGSRTGSCATSWSPCWSPATRRPPPAWPGPSTCCCTRRALSSACKPSSTARTSMRWS